MSTCYAVTGFKTPDEKWKKMKAVWDACIEAEVAPPKVVTDFFGWKTPTSAGAEVDLLAAGLAVEDDDGSISIELEKLPKDMTSISFRPA